MIGSQSPQAGQFNSYSALNANKQEKSGNLESQSPQAGQFNSYKKGENKNEKENTSLNPLKRVNSILTLQVELSSLPELTVSIPSSGSIQFLPLYDISYPKSSLDCLNPLKRVNSILTVPVGTKYLPNPEVSIPSSGSIQFLQNQTLKEFIMKPIESLNPLKRVNSILTVELSSLPELTELRSQSPQAGQFNSYQLALERATEKITEVSIPSSGSIQFLQCCKLNGREYSWAKVSIPSSGSIQFLRIYWEL